MKEPFQNLKKNVSIVLTIYLVIKIAFIKYSDVTFNEWLKNNLF